MKDNQNPMMLNKLYKMNHRGHIKLHYYPNNNLQCRRIIKNQCMKVNPYKSDNHNYLTQNMWHRYNDIHHMYLDWIDIHHLRS